MHKKPLRKMTPPRRLVTDSESEYSDSDDYSDSEYTDSDEWVFYIYWKLRVIILAPIITVKIWYIFHWLREQVL